MAKQVQNRSAPWHGPRGNRLLARDREHLLAYIAQQFALRRRGALIRVASAGLGGLALQLAQALQSARQAAEEAEGRERFRRFMGN